VSAEVKRRAFITLLGGAAAAWPLAARAQQPAMPVVAVLGGARNDAEGQARVRAFTQTLHDLGRIEGRNIRFDFRLAGSDLAQIRAHAAELARTGPAVILAIGTPVLVALREATRTVPIVFANVSDPVDGGFVDSEARPGGNITGFTSFEYSVASKWLELLKEISPMLSRVLILLNPDNYTSRGLLRAIQGAAPTVGVQAVAGRVSTGSEIAPTISAFARQSKGGLVVTPDPLTTVNLGQIIALCNQHRLPGIAFRFYPAAGGLLSYGTDVEDIYRRAATYVDRIVKGEKPGELPVQNPVRYRLTINLKAAETLGLEVPPTLLARADEVIE
jgi:putative tryptophan/tyrosine transport system substrate-binding protein